MRRGIQISLIFLGAVAASGGVLTEVGDCSNGGVSVVVPMSCSVGVPPATSNVGFTTTIGIGTFNGLVGVSAEDNPSLPGDFASGMLSYMDDLFTAGPMRPGFMAVAVNDLTGLNSADGFGEADVSASAQFGSACEFSVNDFGSSGNCTGLMPVELGTAFTFQVGLSADSSAAVGLSSGASVQLTASIEMFEADGFTSVALLDSPEPAGGLLCCVGLGLLGAIRKVMSKRGKP